MHSFLKLVEALLAIRHCLIHRAWGIWLLSSVCKMRQKTAEVSSGGLTCSGEQIDERTGQDPARGPSHAAPPPTSLSRNCSFVVGATSPSLWNSMSNSFYWCNKILWSRQPSFKKCVIGLIVSEGLSPWWQKDSWELASQNTRRKRKLTWNGASLLRP